MKIDVEASKKRLEQLLKLHQEQDITEASRKTRAIQIVELCTREEMDKILLFLNKDNRKIVAEIEDVVLFEDLSLLGPEEFKRLYDQFTPELIGLALRLASEKLKQKFLQEISPEVQQVVNSVLNGPPQKKIEVAAAITQIMNYVRSMQKQGLFTFFFEGKQVLR